ncbi:MAG TPA: hypothetical protein VKV26_20050, partial [Dehalococcoidia bacterium]|nr:hypothetical protein [Dehalococcoidia bacterium]
TVELVRSSLPPGASLRSLGVHRLRGAGQPETIFQLEAPDLAATFPPLKTLDARPNNLPLQLTSFVGREPELAALTALLGQHRLVTLTGPGGTGKTRLALAAAAEALVTFPDGVCFVDLAPLGDPASVPSAVAQALGVQEQPGVPPRASVRFVLRDKHLLLVPDNFEHLLAAAEFVAFLLQAAPALHVLVTSRAPLRVPGEREYAVPPLPLPAPDAAGSIAGSAAVALFVARAQDVRADFALTTENAAAVAAICAKLDGLPLAIELAAARARALPPAALLARLEHSLPLLTGGARTVPARQQTLRDAIDWSHALLAPAEQTLFRRLAVFAGGCTLEVAEAVCNADGDLGPDVLDGVDSLVEKSLLRQPDGPEREPRYRMLETIREFALEQLEVSGDAEAVRRELAVQMQQIARGAAAASNWRQLDAELDNVRAVLGWCIARADLDVGVRVFWAVRWYLEIRNLFSEREGWRRALLALPAATAPSISRARLLSSAMTTSVPVSELDRVEREVIEGVALSRELSDTLGLASAVYALSMRYFRERRWEECEPLAEEAAALFQRSGAPDLAIEALGYQFTGALMRGDEALAEALLGEMQRLAPTARRRTTAAAVHVREGQFATARGEYGRARALFAEVVHGLRVSDGATSTGHMVFLIFLAWAALLDGDVAAAAATGEEAIRLQRGRLRPHGIGVGDGSSMAIEFVGAIAGRCGMFQEAALLLSAGTNWQGGDSGMPVPVVVETRAAIVARVRAELGEAAFAEQWAAGAALSPEEAIELGAAVAAEIARPQSSPESFSHSSLMGEGDDLAQGVPDRARLGEL